MHVSFRREKRQSSMLIITADRQSVIDTDGTGVMVKLSTVSTHGLLQLSFI